MAQSDYKSRIAQGRHQRVMALIETLPIMPTSIHVPARIMQLYRSPDAPPIDAFAEVLIADAALSAKVLELANSAWFKPPKPITRVSDALKRIGLSNLLPLLFGLSLAGIFNKADLAADERTALWQTALLKGILAREWVRWKKIDKQEEAFLCGVLQDIALPAMIAADRSSSAELSGLLDLGDDHRAEREAMLYSADHAGFGGIVCSNLRLPKLYIDATATHHAPRGAVLPEEYHDLVPGLRLAAAVPHAMTRLDEHGARRLADCFFQIEPDTTPEEFQGFIKRAVESGSALMSLLSASSKLKPAMKQFLQDVAEEISRTMFRAIGDASSKIVALQATQAELEEKIRQLTEQVARADFDPLTHVLGRRALLDRADKLMALARKFKMACVVGYIDLDDFKGINQRLGLETGDRALVACASALREMVQNRGLIGRCGGDEFAFVIVVPLEFAPAALDREIERAIGTLTVAAGPAVAPLASSVGIAWLGTPDEKQGILDALSQAGQKLHAVRKAA